jgi:hypothetical protein
MRLLRCRFARFLELLPARRVLERLIIFRDRILGLALFHEHIIPRFQWIGPVRTLMIGVIEFACCAVKIPMVCERHPPRVVTRRNTWTQPHRLRVPFLCTRPVAPQIEDIASEPFAVHEGESPDGSDVWLIPVVATRTLRDASPEEVAFRRKQPRVHERFRVAAAAVDTWVCATDDSHGVSA